MRITSIHQQILGAFQRCDARQGNVNLVSLVLLRPASGLCPDEFNRTMRDLVRAGILSSSQAERRLTDADRAAAIREGDNLLLYVSRR